MKTKNLFLSVVVFLLFLLIFCTVDVSKNVTFAQAYEASNNALKNVSVYFSDDRLYYNIEKNDGFEGNIYAAVYDSSQNLCGVEINKLDGYFDNLLSNNLYIFKTFIWSDTLQSVCDPVQIKVCNGSTILTGIVVENNITNLDNGININNSAEKTINLYITDYSEADEKYKTGDIVKLYCDNIDIKDYLGYEIDAVIDNDNIVSAALTDVNKTVYYTLDKYISLDKENSIIHFKGDADGSDTELCFESDCSVVYNGIGGYALSDVFDKIVMADSTYSGDVTLVDNDDVLGYDVVFINVAASAVVDELTTRGVVTFKNAVGNRLANNVVTVLDFTDEASYINITKDGEPYDYTALTEWDVLSIVANTAGYYDVEVLSGDSSKIIGTVSGTAYSDTSSDGLYYTIDGIDYDLAEGAYLNGSLRENAYGSFYIDKYGKIAAYIKIKEDNYAYILNATAVYQTFGKIDVILQLLCKDGTIQYFSLDSTVTVYNPPKSISPTLDDYAIFKYDDYDESKLDEVVDDFIGQIVAIETTDKLINVITLPCQKYSSVDPLTTLYEVKAGAWSYDEDTKVIAIANSKQYITDDTLVFFVGGPNDTFAPNTSPVSSYDTKNCFVSSGAALSTMSGSSAVAYTNCSSTGDIDVLVLYNTDIAASPSSGVAYVTAVGNSSVDDTNVLSVLQ